MNETLQSHVESLPLNTVFELGDEISAEQQAFLTKHGFLHFRGVASQSEVDSIIAEVDRIQAEWLNEERKEVFGIPLFKGHENGKKEAEINWRNGMLHGLFESWYDNGTNRAKGNWKEKKKEGLWAVSYTHLRAHETPEHLVFRHMR